MQTRQDSITVVIRVRLLPDRVADGLTGVMHQLHLLVHHFQVIAGLLLADVDGPQLLAISLDGLLDSLGQIVNRLLHLLTIVHLDLIEPAPLRFIKILLLLFIPCLSLLLVCALLGIGLETGCVLVLLEVCLFLLSGRIPA